jgi:hypothetical protein
VTRHLVGLASLPAKLLPALLFMSAAAAQGDPAGRGMRPRLEAGLGFGGALVEDGSGATLAAGLGPFAGAGIAWGVAPRTTLAIGARAATATVRGEGGGSEWSAGRAWRVDVLVGLEQRLFGCAAEAEAPGCLAAHAGGGAVWLSGPRDVVPFRFGGNGLHFGGEVGASVRLLRARPLFATVSAGALRLGGESVLSPIGEPGWSRRFLVGVRHGR